MDGMSAESLKLPEGVIAAKRTQGMRVVVSYSVNLDGFVVRFDTMFNGNQYNIAYRIDDETSTTIADRAEELIPMALKAWVDNNWARGRQIWFANDPRL